MQRFFAFLAILFGIPAFGFVAGEGLRRYYEGQFADAIKDAADPVLRLFTLADVCSIPEYRSRLTDGCETLDNIVLMRDASIWAAVAAVLMIILIWIAARISNHNRTLLVALFAPGVRLVLLVLFAMIIVQGAIAAYGAYIVESVLINRVHFVLIGGIAIGAVLGAFNMIVAGMSLSKSSPLSALATEVSQEREQKLWEFVAGIAKKVGAREPRHIVVGLDTSFYATAAPVVIPGANDPLSGETLYLSLPLMWVLTHSELAAVVGHELGHFKGDDTAYSLRFVPIYSSLTRSIHGLAKHEGSSAIALLPAMAVLSFFLERFAVSERMIGRQREIEADRVGASVGGADALASSLIKVSALAPMWEFVRDAMTNMLNKGQSLVNASVYFSDHVVATLVPNIDKTKLFSEIATSRLTHPTDTHPPLSERLDALGVHMSELGNLLARNGEPSSELLADTAEVEQALTDHLAALYVRLGYAHLPEPKDA